MPDKRSSQGTSATPENQPLLANVTAEPDTDAAIELEVLTLHQSLDTTTEKGDGTDSEPVPQPPAAHTGNATITTEHPSLPSSTIVGTIANGEPMASWLLIPVNSC